MKGDDSGMKVTVKNKPLLVCLKLMKDERLEQGFSTLVPLTF